MTTLNMAFSEEQIQIIAGNPLNESLKYIRAKFCDCADASTDESDVIGLLGALVVSPVALNLPAPDGNGNVAIRLATVLQTFLLGSLEPEKLRPLLDVVNSSDTDIWAAVYDFLNTINPLTPPWSTTMPTFVGSPVKANSSWLADSEKRETVEGELFHEIKKCTFRAVKGFWDKFLKPERWRKDQKAMLRGVMSAHNGQRWTEFPSTPDEQPVWDWLRSLEERFLADTTYKLHTTKTAAQFKGPKGQMDLFFQIPTPASNNKFEYKNVLVVGEQKRTYHTDRFKSTLLQLARHVRGVFSDQPTRRFVHAFTLSGSIMELWIFDRSGPYSSGPFDIHEEPRMFARALVGYATMGDDEMGLDTFIERGGAHRHVTLDGTGGKETKMQLVKAMVRQHAIVCRGTTCYKTKDGHVAKFSWASDKRKLEVEQLKLAEERGVEGVARVVAHRRITTIADLREGLKFPKVHHFRDEAVHFEGLPAAGSSKTSGHERKSSSNNTSDTPGPKRRRSSRKSKFAQKLDNQLSVGKNKPSLYMEDEEPWENRIYVCLVVSPAGRVISDFRNIKELLEPMRDAIRAHRSLYTVGNILHRDISSNNILITEPRTENDFKGMLIDLDLAKVRDSGPSGARHQTGTMQFMAVEVLCKVDHTYRHDLESFFYVLLWMCARQSWSNGFAGQRQPPKVSLLRRWEMGDFDTIAQSKAGDMSVFGLERIMREFPDALDAVKPLCLRIRKLLFPHDKDERMIFGTPVGAPDQLYRPMIAAYDEEISKL
ncbi:serine/threonine-protein kinase Sgk2 [Durotheca rogersii]|uniref:serine/threonine-protein kinase Sgk2 n=1 Tax=Durotheca rogersii TaxID=419775 RepID=UPI0022204EF6|nr:serine/threonine-protein kinase Sgk2 [Durotheca rogersii]KAI5862977.1 serine/threonine-protein kinase Sgk2 [Durotheca rogersii]